MNSITTNLKLLYKDYGYFYVLYVLVWAIVFSAFIFISNMEEF